MRLEREHICIRTAVAEDAAQLTTWWNDGSVMAHAGFPLGLGTTVEEVTRKLLDENYNGMRLILEWNGTPIGEMCYRDMDDSSVDIGIKICNPDFQEKGIGRVALSMLIRHLFSMGFSKIVLDTNLKNLRAQHVYEKLGFRKTAVMMDFWKNQVGEMESAVAYELTENTFVDFS